MVSGVLFFVVIQKQDDKNKFIGTWVLTTDNEYQITFYNDGRFVGAYAKQWGTWDIKDGKLVLNITDNTSSNYPNQEYTAIFDYSFRNNHQILTISVIAGNTFYGSMTFTKVNSTQ